ncbi:penicillin acylase family protein [Halopseudomonas pachastrellae]|nr:penicillin acylase family protein [Halopseudomonas pachastrellae]
MTIQRDGFGIPHVQAESAEALMYGAGWAKAQDRLFEMDFMGRLVKGTLAEVFGPDYVAMDTQARTIWETEAEAQRMIDELPEEHKLLFSAYVKGFNAYVKMAQEDPTNYLPLEFSEAGANIPLPPDGYSETDMVRMGIYGVKLIWWFRRAGAAQPGIPGGNEAPLWRGGRSEDLRRYRPAE